MAKKKKKTTHHRRRRHHRGMGAIDTQSLLGTAIGALGAKLLNKVIPDTLDKRIVAGGKLAIGIFLPHIVREGKSKALLHSVGNGFVAVGTLELVEGFGVTLGENVLGADDETTLAVALEGIEDVEFEDVSENVLGDDEYMDDNDLSVINAGEDLSVVNADDDDDM